MSDFYEALPYQTKNKNVYKTQHDRLQDFILHVTSGNILVSLLVIYAFCFFMTNQAEVTKYQTGIWNRSDLQNEYWICSYKQLYEAKFSIFKKSIESAFQKWFTISHLYEGER